MLKHLPMLAQDVDLCSASVYSHEPSSVLGPLWWSGHRPARAAAHHRDGLPPSAGASSPGDPAPALWLLESMLPPPWYNLHNIHYYSIRDQAFRTEGVPGLFHIGNRNPHLFCWTPASWLIIRPEINHPAPHRALSTSSLHICSLLTAWSRHQHPCKLESKEEKWSLGSRGCRDWFTRED